MLQYRYGFLCHHKAEAMAGSWPGMPVSFVRHDVQDFVIWLHPETRLEVVAHAAGDIVVLGDAYCHSGMDLQARLAGLEWSDPWPGIDDLGGRFAILFLSGASIRAANDPFGSRMVFYAPDRMAIASHSALLAGALGIERSEPVAAFMASAEYKSRTVGYLPGDLTIFSNMFALVPNNYWDGQGTHRYWPRGPMTPTSRKDFLSASMSYFEAFHPFIQARYTPVFGITGGIDSRAGFAPFADDFLGMTRTRPLKDDERPIISEIVSKLGVEHVRIDPSEYRPGEISRAAGSAGGGMRSGRRTYVEGMAKEFGGANNVFIRGYGGEILRGFPIYQKRNNVFSHTAMTYTYSTSMRGTEKGKDYLAFCHEAFEGFWRRANYDGIDRFGYKVWDLFYWEHRMGMWGASMLNEMDPTVYSMVAFNSRPLYEAGFGLTDNERLTKELLNDVVRMYSQELADIPYT